MKGVLCNKCQTAIMKRYYGGWICLQCNHQDKDAHKKALHDYCLLFSDNISNKDCRDFLQITSSSLAWRLLKQKNFT